MQGIYFYADFCNGLIWGLGRIGDIWQSALLYDAPFQITGVGEDEDGNLYETNYTEGIILVLEEQIQFAAATPTSTAVATVPPREQPSKPSVSLAEQG